MRREHRSPLFRFAAGLLVAIVLCTSVAGTPGNDDKTEQQLADLSRRLRTLETGLSLTSSDLSNVPVSRRLEKLERTADQLSERVGRVQASPQAAQDASAAIANVRSQQQDLSRRVERLQTDMRDAARITQTLQQLRSDLDTMKRSLDDLERRVARIERD